MTPWIEGARTALPLPETPDPRAELMRRTGPLFPWLPIVTGALLVGASVAALALAVRANRRAAALEGALEQEEAHESLHQQALETISP